VAGLKIGDNVVSHEKCIELVKAHSDCVAATIVTFVAGGKCYCRTGSNMTANAGAETADSCLIQSVPEVPEQFAAEDMHPLFIRQADILYHAILQSNPDPCDDNVITIAIQTNVPLLATSAGGCQPVIIIKGLTSSNTGTQGLALVNVQMEGQSSVGAPEALPGNGTWTQDVGMLVIDLSGLAGVVKAGPVYTFDFQLQNPAHWQAAPSVTMELTGLGQSTGDLSMEPPARAATTVHALHVLEADIVISSMSQSSAHPCDLSVITITFAMQVRLVEACSPTLTISGLSESLTVGTTAGADIAINSHCPACLPKLRIANLDFYCVVRIRLHFSCTEIELEKATRWLPRHKPKCA
jgi:hypothetical protein